MGAGQSQSEGPPEEISLERDLSSDGAEAGFATATLGAAAATLAEASELPAPPSLVAEYRIDMRPSGLLGMGAFGKVRLARSIISGHRVAVKVVKRQRIDARAEELLRREVRHHEKLRHVHIVRLFAWVKTPQRYYLVMEHCAAGDLLALVNDRAPKLLGDDEARDLFSQLLAGIAFCHSLAIFHRDLKLENLLLCRRDDDGTQPTDAATAAGSTGAASPFVLKIADFGLSALNPVGLSSTFCGSPLYTSPELWAGAGAGARTASRPSADSSENPPSVYDASKSDMWSCGVILYAMLASTLPFDAGDLSELVRMIRAAAPRAPIPASRGPAAADLVQALLSHDPAARPSAADASRHAWLAPPPPSCKRQRSEPPGASAASGEGQPAPRCADGARKLRSVSETTDFFRRLREEVEAEQGVARAATEMCDAVPCDAMSDAPARSAGAHLTKRELDEIRAERAEMDETA